MAMKHLYKIYPKRTLRGIRPKEIMEPTVLENLNRQEFLKCFNAGELYAIINDEEVHIKECNYDKAEALFVEKKTVEEPTVSVVTPVAHEEVNENQTQIEVSVLETTTDTTAPQIESDPKTDIENSDELTGDDTSATPEAPTVTEDNIAITGNSNDEQVVPESSENTVEVPTPVAEETKTAEDEAPDQDDTEKPSNDETVDAEKVIEEEVDKKEQQPQQYNKNHNKQQNQTNYRNQNNGKHNKGKFVINNK